MPSRSNSCEASRMSSGMDSKIPIPITANGSTNSHFHTLDFPPNAMGQPARPLTRAAIIKVRENLDTVMNPANSSLPLMPHINHVTRINTSCAVVFSTARNVPNPPFMCTYYHWYTCVNEISFAGSSLQQHLSQYRDRWAQYSEPIIGMQYGSESETSVKLLE